MSDALKREIFSGVQDVIRRCETVMAHIGKDRHKSVIWDALKCVKKDTDSLLKWAKEEYRKECYGIRKEQE
jgi:hypothetical protein